MSNMNNLKNFCDFVTSADNSLNDYDAATKRHLFIEHIYNLMVESGVDHDNALAVATALASSFLRSETKNHSVDIDGRSFYTANVVDKYDGCDYDMTVIFCETDDAPQLIDYYYGEPDVENTKLFVGAWLNENK